MGKEETIKQRPLLSKNGLKGSGLYYDALKDDAKITLEVIYDALHRKNAEALNHEKVIEVQEKMETHCYQNQIDESTKLFGKKNYLLPRTIH